VKTRVNLKAETALYQLEPSIAAQRAVPALSWGGELSLGGKDIITQREATLESAGGDRAEKAWGRL